MTYDNIRILINEYVYEPAEDSYILAKTVESIFNKYQNECDKGVFMEIGSGSGYVSIYLLSSIKHYLYGILTDILPCAVYASWKSVKRNGLDMYIDVVQCNSVECFRNSFTSIVFFNPPYLPVEEFNHIGISWSGGNEGIEVWEKFFNDAIHICLKNACRIIFIFSSTQNVMKLLDKTLNICNDVEIYECNKFFYETICSAIVRC